MYFTRRSIEKKKTMVVGKTHAHVTLNKIKPF